MKFTVIENKFNPCNIELLGFRIKADSDLIFDKQLFSRLCIERGERYANNIIDDLYDGFEPICKGEDGKLYAVHYEYMTLYSLSLSASHEVEAPLFWQEVEMIKWKNLIY